MIANTFIDRVHFVEPETLVDLAKTILRDLPENDRGLRKSIVRYITTRLPNIFRDQEALEDLFADPAMSAELLRYFAEMQLTGGVIILPLTLHERPPIAPMAPLFPGGFAALELPQNRN